MCPTDNRQTHAVAQESQEECKLDEAVAQKSEEVARTHIGHRAM